MNEKQFVTATLFALVLLVLVFTPIAHQQGGGTYDPWLDYNEDGKIDVNELNPLGQAYGTTGDPTKNVTVVGHATKVLRLATGEIIPSGTWSSGWISVDGYAKMTVLVYLTTTMNVYRLHFSDSTHPRLWTIDLVNNFEVQYAKTYDVMNQEILIEIVNSGGPQQLWVDVYLMA